MYIVQMLDISQESRINWIDQIAIRILASASLRG